MRVAYYSINRSLSRSLIGGVGHKGYVVTIRASEG